MNLLQNIYVFFSVTFFMVILNALESQSMLGGRYPKLDDVPYQVAIKSSEYLCGGGIIDESHVLTSAYCMFDKKTKEFLKGNLVVIASTLNLYSPKIKVGIKRIYVPSRFAMSQLYDIAVLELDEPLNFENSSTLGKLEIPKSNENYTGKTAKIAGFGWNWADIVRNNKTEKEELHGGWFYYYMKFLNVEVLHNDDCQRIYSDMLITEQQICAKTIPYAKDRLETVCTGDVGSPLVIDGKVIGILSARSPGCKKTTAVYTRVSEFTQFIENAMKNTISEDIRVHDYVKRVMG